MVFRKQRADPEDVEFFECQQEMREELRNKYLEVERVIGEEDNSPF